MPGLTGRFSRRTERPRSTLADPTADLPSLQRFAQHPERDFDAETAGLSPWNSRVVEGHVDRIKMLKRQMFGRTSFEPLRKRSCRAPERRFRTHRG
ncbi:hypothetical protein [Streptomyces cadmiisoli]|uniref:Transposase IS204/IS1001/IS1096/IS1165 DDE domain-containing protein n=1 Tax=Streptomyces cadmiisoli TaxID=2184053 RepID=A0A2Z4IRP7_9ACTN|nr:hypothetical protein [Streptomyces cadmiisoli]AWW35505.1 hypothetical protein DN051_01485 [Streptomyces cadmiisoli]